MRLVLFFLFAVVRLFARSGIGTVTDNEPSTLVEGVSVITGDFCMRNQICTVQGAEPIHLNSTYVSEGGFLTGYEYCKVEFKPLSCWASIQESYGTQIEYFWENYGKKPKRGKKHDKKITSHVYIPDRFIRESLGISNTASGTISARTHLKNHRLILHFDPERDLRSSHFVFYAADGTIRHYGRGKERDQLEVPNTGLFENDTIGTRYEYLLVKEDLPNGHILQYFWDHDRLIEVRSANQSGKKVFASMRVDRKSPELWEYTGSDDQKSALHRTFSGSAKELVTQKVVSPNQLDLSFDWTAKQMMIDGKPRQKGYMSSFSLGGERTFRVHYNMGDQYTKPKVSHLQAPVGKDATPHTTHRFIYGDHKTDVFDIEGNKTSYYWNGEGRLTVIERFIGDSTFHSKEHFAWIDTLLVSRSLWDDKGACKYIRSFQYDPHGNVTQHRFSGNLIGKGWSVYQNPNGSVDHTRTETCITFTDYSQDGKHLPIRVEDPAGLVTLYTYVPGTNLVKTKVLCDRAVPKITHVYDYDEDFLLIQEAIDDGISKKIKRIFPKQTQPFIGMPEIIEEKYIEGGQEKLLKKRVLKYCAGAKIEQEDIYDANGTFCYSLTYKYDEKNRIIRETNALGQEALSRYDASGNRYYYKDFGSPVEETSEYDFSSRLIKKTCKAPEEEQIYEYSYDTKHRLEWESDERGHRTYYKYDFLGRCIETTEPALYTDQGQIVCPTTQRNYDAAGNEILRIDANKFVTKTEYNAYGKPLHILHPDGTEEKFLYTIKGDLESHIGQNGIKTVYKYDYLSRIIEKTLFEKDTQISQETFGYTGYLLTSQIDPEGNVTTYKYDGAGRKIAETFGPETTLYTYDSLGRLFTIQEGAEITYKFYDLLDRVCEERKETLSGQVLKKELYAYDEPGNRISITRFIENEPAEERFDYDSFRRLIKKTNPLGNAETISYSNILDENGQNVPQKVHIDALGLQTIETFDPNGNLHQIEKWKEKTLFLSKKFYTLSGKPSSQIDQIFAPDGSQRSVTTQWEYDSMGREITIIEAANAAEEKVTRKTYTLTGELKTLIKPDKTQIIYDYNSLKQLIAIDTPDGSIHHRMTYNRLGHLQTTDGLQRTTDPKGRVLSETFPGGCTIQHHYDSCGRKTSLDIPSKDISIVYGYLGNVLQTISRYSGDQKLYSHTYLERDLACNILQEQLIDASNVKIHRFDPISRKISIQSPYFSQTLEEFDPVGNLLSMTRHKETRTYRYDELYQLTLETGRFAHTYSYDSLHNRLTKDEEFYKTNALHQDISHFAYNDNGCPYQGQNISFVYDALDRLIEIATPSDIQRFSYDSLHRCLSKTTYRGNDKTTQYFLYDGQKEIGSLDENLSLNEFRVLGEALHAELGAAISIELDGKIFIPLHDLQSNLAALVPLDDSNLTRYDYSAFGEEIQDGPTLSPWSFSSKRRDKESGLVHYGRRFYIPTLGHWLTPDPSGFTDGMNLYAYVKNEPLMHFDEYGLWGEYRPMGALYSQEIRQNWMAVYNSPRFQGAMQMMGGASLMAKGLPLLSTPLFLAGAASIAYGADVFATGLHSFVNGTPRPTTTRTLLEQTGMSPTMAAVTEFAISPRGGPKSAGQISKLTSKDLGFFGKIQNGQKFRPFTKGYYRDNLKILTGKNPPNNIDAHHVFPQHFRERFLQCGINIDDPKYLVWWESKLHRPTAKEYNDIWVRFFRNHPRPAPNKILEEGKELMKRYGLDVNY